MRTRGGSRPAVALPSSRATNAKTKKKKKGTRKKAAPDRGSPLKQQPFLVRCQSAAPARWAGRLVANTRPQSAQPQGRPGLPRRRTAPQPRKAAAKPRGRPSSAPPKRPGNARSRRGKGVTGGGSPHFATLDDAYVPLPQRHEIPPPTETAATSTTAAAGEGEGAGEAPSTAAVAPAAAPVRLRARPASAGASSLTMGRHSRQQQQQKKDTRQVDQSVHAHRKVVPRRVHEWGCVRNRSMVDHGLLSRAIAKQHPRWTEPQPLDVVGPPAPAPMRAMPVHRATVSPFGERPRTAVRGYAAVAPK